MLKFIYMFKEINLKIVVYSVVAVIILASVFITAIYIVSPAENNNIRFGNKLITSTDLSEWQVGDYWSNGMRLGSVWNKDLGWCGRFKLVGSTIVSGQFFTDPDDDKHIYTADQVCIKSDNFDFSFVGLDKSVNEFCVSQLSVPDIIRKLKNKVGYGTFEITKFSFYCEGPIQASINKIISIK